MTTNDQYTYDVFLSHSSADKDIVRRFAMELRDAGLNVWFDEWVVAFGDDIYLSVESGLQRSRTLALFISQNALASDWVSLERSTVLFRDPNNKTRRFVPIVLGDCNIPDTLSRYRYIDTRPSIKAGISQLLAACRGQGNEPVVITESATLETYRESHIRRYSVLTEGRHLVSLRAVGHSGSRVDANSEIYSWAKSSYSSRLVVLGDPGSGKTFLLRQLCARLCKESEFTPVFINAGQLRHLRPTSRQELVTHADPVVPSAAIMDVDKLVLVIDGLDELMGPTSLDQAGFLDTVGAVSELIPTGSRLIISCRSIAFETTSKVITEAFRPRRRSQQAVDITDSAIHRALGTRNDDRIERIELVELTKDQASAFLSRSVGTDAAEDHAATYVLEHLPRVPVILRFLQLALPELQSSTGRIDLDELYSAAIRAWILRDPAFADQNIDDVWNELQANPIFGGREVGRSAHLGRLEHAGLLTRTPRGAYVWSHFSMGEFFFSVSLFGEIREFKTGTLARLNLIGSYNINRFLVPMCRRALRPAATGEPVRAVTAEEYKVFLRATGWRRSSGYGVHGSYIAQDGTGFMSGVDELDPEPHTEPRQVSHGESLSGLSWYDAFAYCLWSGTCLPDSFQIRSDRSLGPGVWYWCADWSDERKAHIAVATGTSEGAIRRGGVNPDFRHSQIGLAVVGSVDEG